MTAIERVEKNPEFLGLCKACLAGDCPQGILADWLEEHGISPEILSGVPEGFIDYCAENQARWFGQFDPVSRQTEHVLGMARRWVSEKLPYLLRYLRNSQVFRKKFSRLTRSERSMDLRAARKGGRIDRNSNGSYTVYHRKTGKAMVYVWTSDGRQWDAHWMRREDALNGDGDGDLTYEGGGEPDPACYYSTHDEEARLR